MNITLKNDHFNQTGDYSFGKNTDRSFQGEANKREDSKLSQTGNAFQFSK